MKLEGSTNINSLLWNCTALKVTQTSKRSPATQWSLNWIKTDPKPKWSIIPKSVQEQSLNNFRNRLGCMKWILKSLQEEFSVMVLQQYHYQTIFRKIKRVLQHMLILSFQAFPLLLNSVWAKKAEKLQCSKSFTLKYKLKVFFLPCFCSDLRILFCNIEQYWPFQN